MKKGLKILGVFILGLLLVTGCKKTTTYKETIKTKDGITVGGKLNITNLFTSRDLEQTADTTDAKTYTIKGNENINISTEGVYVITGEGENVSIIVEVKETEKVQLVLDNLKITNTDSPCIYVKSADKVFITTLNDNSLTVTGSFKADGTTSTDSVIFSKEDLVLNGTGTLTISSTENGISSKDDLKITGGVITIDCVDDALEANDSVAINDGTITINTKKDGIHAEYDEDNTVGYVYIGGGTINITAGDDAIHATTILQIDNGTITLKAAEGLEGTFIQINDGTLNITASDDGMNAGQKSKYYTPTIEINGGTITIDMGQGDTDAIDANGNLYINGGTLNITAQSPFDYDGEAKYNGGKIIVNGEETTTITNQFMGGGQQQGGQQPAQPQQPQQGQQQQGGHRQR